MPEPNPGTAKVVHASLPSSSKKMPTRPAKLKSLLSNPTTLPNAEDHRFPRATPTGVHFVLVKNPEG